MSLSDSQYRDLRPMIRPYIIEQMWERDLSGVVEIEEMSGLNRWGYDAYRRELLSNENSVMLAARNLAGDGPQVIGFLAGWTVEDELHVNNIATHPDYRRIGVGQRLMETGVDIGRRRGTAYVLLEVRASNEVAQLLYRKMGFNYVGRRRDYYRLPAEDAFVMKLDI
ncbi:MAG: ribosomal protein S18-alanine N-acetyltransferase [Blastocatellia bacterium]|nr:ribosomal protein S18-alanine N-acetyltransferase [Blastocatellia bacterium]